MNTNLAAASFLQAEQENLAQSLRKDLKMALNSRDDALKRLKQLEEYRNHAEGELALFVDIKERAESVQVSCGKMFMYSMYLCYMNDVT